MGHAVSRIKVGPKNKGQAWARGKLSAGCSTYATYYIHTHITHIRHIRLAGYLEQCVRDALILSANFGLAVYEILFLEALVSIS